MSRAPNSGSSRPPPAGAGRDEPALRLVRDARIEEQKLYERLAPVVNRLLWTFLGPDAERDDVAHDVFVRILRSASKVRDASKLEAWAARVTMNAIKNEFRRRKFRRWFSLEASEDSERFAYHPDFEGREVLLHTYEILERLPTRERLPFSLRLLQQKSADEIAEVCGTSVRTTKRRLQAGRARFLKLAASDPVLGPRLAKLVEAEGRNEDG